MTRDQSIRRAMALTVAAKLRGAAHPATDYVKGNAKPTPPERMLAAADLHEKSAGRLAS